MIKITKSLFNKMSDKKFRVLVTHPEFPQPAIKLLEEKFEVDVCSSVPPNRQEILEKSKGVAGIVWANHEKLNAEALDAAGKQLKGISTMSAGIDYVDVDELRKRNIPLGNTTGILSDAVADLTIGLMIAAARRFQEGRSKIEQSQWETNRVEWMMGQDIRNSTVGFMGFGSIGQRVAKRLKTFDVGKFIYHTPHKKPNEDELNASHVTFNELLCESDFIIVACPLTPDTKNIFNEKAFSSMKSNCVFVNISRGDIVDQCALYDALEQNTIFAAGLDVMTPEPLPANDVLLCLPNCVITPHLGSATLRTRTEMAMVAAQNVINAIAGEQMVVQAYK